MDRKTLELLLRQTATILGTALVAKGAVSQEQVDSWLSAIPEIAGVLLIVISLVTALIRRKQEQRKLVTALATKTPMTEAALTTRIRQGLVGVVVDPAAPPTLKYTPTDTPLDKDHA